MFLVRSGGQRQWFVRSMCCSARACTNERMRRGCSELRKRERVRCPVRGVLCEEEEGDRGPDRRVNNDKHSTGVRVACLVKSPSVFSLVSFSSRHSIETPFLNPSPFVPVISNPIQGFPFTASCCILSEHYAASNMSTSLCILPLHT